MNPHALAFIRVSVGAIALLRGVRLAIETWPVAADVSAAHLLGVAAWLVLSTLVIVGWHSRRAAASLVALWFGLLAVDSAFFYWNFIYLIVLSLLLVSLSDCERHYAVHQRDGDGDPPGWPLFLMRCQISIVYLFAAAAKINGEFLSGDVLRHYFQGAVVPNPLPGSLVYAPELLVPLSIAVVTLETFIAIGLWVNRLRPMAIGAALPLHAGMLFITGTWLQLFAVTLFALLMFTLIIPFLNLSPRGRLVVWDDSCSFCRRWIAAFRRLDAFGALRFVGASSPAAYDGTGVTSGAAAYALQLVEPDGRVRSGFDAVQGIMAALPGGFLIAPYMSLPGVRQLGHAAYRRVAERRTCSYQPPAAQTRDGAPVAVSER